MTAEEYEHWLMDSYNGALQKNLCTRITLNRHDIQMNGIHTHADINPFSQTHSDLSQIDMSSSESLDGETDSVVAVNKRQGSIITDTDDEFWDAKSTFNYEKLDTSVPEPIPELSRRERIVSMLRTNWVLIVSLFKNTYIRHALGRLVVLLMICLLSVRGTKWLAARLLTRNTL